MAVLLQRKVSERPHHTEGVINPTLNIVQCGVHRATPTKCVGDTPLLLVSILDTNCRELFVNFNRPAFFVHRFAIESPLDCFSPPLDQEWEFGVIHF